MNKKYTVEQALEHEANMLIEALGCGIELNDLFLELYCNKEFSDLMLQVPYSDRGYVLSYADVIDWQFNGFPPSNDWQHVWLNVSEIEEQFEGEPDEWFEEPDEWFIDGDLAYLNVGYGLSINFNIEELKSAIKEHSDT
jgi:hypothetical protein